tara:strand:- start:2217 stop:2381 length:165 start_codon:yes stop_codon:yes gene_type:complete
MNKAKGLGDSIEKITKATGLKSLANIAARATGFKDCGCNKRKAWLNKQFPYKRY